jgi:hypothetical protein
VPSLLSLLYIFSVELLLPADEGLNVTVKLFSEPAETVKAVDPLKVKLIESDSVIL